MEKQEKCGYRSVDSSKNQEEAGKMLLSPINSIQNEE